MTARPPFIPRTEERELHQFGNLLDRHKDALWYATEKLDGFSFSFGQHDGEFVASNRDREIHADDVSVFGTAIFQMDLATCFLGQNIIAQGELVGPGIRGNRYNLDRLRFFVFNVLRNEKFLDFEEAKEITERAGLECVPMLAKNFKTDRMTCEALSHCSSRIHSGVQREGAVFRPMAERHDEFQRVSFKVFNPRYPFHH